MSPRRSILLAARPQLILLAASLLLAVLLGGGAVFLEERARDELRQQNSQTQHLRDDLNARQTELAYLTSHIQAFRTLKAQGLLEAPGRENWVENLLATRRELRLPDTLAYTLPPSRPLIDRPDATAATNTPAATEPPPADTPLIYDLEIRLRDIHEGELLNFLAAFQTPLKERFRVQSCLLNNPGATGLEAHCTLRFFTLPPDTKQP